MAPDPRVQGEGPPITGSATRSFIGAALMIAGGIVAIFLRVKAEGQSLENIAKPLTAEEAHADA